MTKPTRSPVRRTEAARLSQLDTDHVHSTNTLAHNQLAAVRGGGGVIIEGKEN